MTTIIAIERPDGVIFGWDRQVTHGARRVLGGDKVFTNAGIVFGHSGDVLDGNIIEYADLPKPPKKLAGADADRWVTRELIPAIQSTLSGREATSKKESKVSSNGSFLVAVAERIYQVSSDLSWLRSSDGMYAIGSGSDFALGALHAGADIDRALEIATRLDVYTGPDCASSTVRDLVSASRSSETP